MDVRAVQVEVRESIAHVTLTQPERGNPFDQAFCSQLCEAAIECDETPGVRAILIRAQGKYFSVGADLKWLGADRALLPRRLKAATADLHMAISRFARCDAPVVLAAHGLVTGGAVALTAMADFAVAGRSARFYAAYNAIGFVSDGAGTYFIPRRVGTRRAAEFLMLNQMWSAGQAAEYGLISRLVEDADLEAEAMALARQVASGPTKTYGEMKRLLLSTHDQPLETQLEFEARAISQCAKTDDSWNAIQAVLAKRKPEFSGR
ncbi:2-(1,2-epoxy-1,2-dihydrophenyl)acetyl-CoA isomerase [Panacagrimonas perspica]|uniref:2-(1,2-epoxy-1,2-dihydrophenyl)acetyl-CoA isomerase n=1 Tax=Panacagrimonas perspica TaxID=381431 RepID=A0A4R7P1Y2_9GAMM|nr:enoyl-CoA hydratase/isomerase family protein [Panacagrimonas perspica]TDU26890.1 2-(1,2-epoxy-1,2-dihydrophenyl)acetyl-CoA isomerase [Panacagrimonas perspica]THD03658.1 enoyl-CoA hydratase [Panacagrimonas perspica]